MSGTLVHFVYSFTFLDRNFGFFFIYLHFFRLVFLVFFLLFFLLIKLSDSCFYYFYCGPHLTVNQNREKQ